MNVSRPSDLDILVDAVSGGGALHAYAAGHQGEMLYVSERVVVSPSAGVFEPAGDRSMQAGEPVDVGTVLGTVSGAEILSPFSGTLKGHLAHPGERVQAGQPIAWLHAS
ncbi:MAG: hypothetical protein JO337_01295 [Acidimicrobiales bacterium]|nr:hypothetical protein [Acidimicrobiales bacterium]